MAKDSEKTGRELERQVADTYRRLGARKVEHDVELAGHQIDVYVELETPGSLPHRVAIEAKNWSRRVGVDVVNAFAAVADSLRENGLIHEGIIVSSSGFSRQARNAAETYGIRLLEMVDLEAMVLSKKSEYAYDVFISHSYGDEEWVRNELLPRLESAGIKAFIGYRDFEPGAPLMTEMERAVLTSRKTILVLTPAYLDSRWTELESLHVYTLDPGARQRRLLPVLLQPCEIPLRIRTLTYVDLCQPQLYEIQFQRLLDAIAADVPGYSGNDEPPTVRIPAGPFLMGSASDDPDARDNEKPRRQVDLPACEIGRYTVTNAQYARFLADNPHYPVPHSEKEGDRLYNWDPQARIYPVGKADHPVVLVSWEDATAYCDWLSQIAGKHCHLPTEEEWEKAARGGLPETRLYPWGDDWGSGFCNTKELGENGTTSVHEFESENRSPFGAIDMVGNVWEWTASWYEPYPDSLQESAEYGHLYRVVRGGSWRSSYHGVRISCRGRYRPNERRPYLGFRIAIEASKQIDRAELRPTEATWDDIDFNLLEQYLTDCHVDNSQQEEKIRRYLLQSNLLSDDETHLTRAGALLLCREGRMPAGLFTDVFIYDERSVVGTPPRFGVNPPVYKILQRVKEYLEDLFASEHEPEYTPYPQEAIVEALANFLIHRDYTSEEAGIIEIKDDAVTFINPGHSLTDVGDLSKAWHRRESLLPPQLKLRNPNLTQALHATGISQMQGRGLLRVRQSLVENASYEPDGALGLDIESDEKLNRFTLKVHKKLPAPSPRAEPAIPSQAEHVYRFQVGDVIADRYQVVAPLGFGGFAEVFHCKDVQLNREVAVKVLNDKGMTINEALAVACSEHPHIVYVYDISELEDATLFIVLRYIAGETLERRLNRSQYRRLSLDAEALDIMRQIAEALDYAHGQEVIHGNVEPSNILLDSQRNAYLGGFSLAYVKGPRENPRIPVDKYRLAGSIPYVAPEQLKEEKLGDERSDIYSLGVVVYEMLTGQLPYRGRGAGLIYQITTSEPFPPTLANLDLSKEVETVLLKVLSKDPQDRYPSAEAFVSALTTAVQGQVARRCFLAVSHLAKAMPLVGDTVSISICVTPEYPGPNSIPIDSRPGEVSFLIQADGFRIPEGQNAVTLSLPDRVTEIIEATVEIQARSPGKHAIVVEPFYDGQRHASLFIAVDIQPRATFQKPELPDPLGPLSALNPDLVLRVYVLPLDLPASRVRLDYVLYSSKPGFHLPGTPVKSVEISTAQLARVRARLGRLLRQSSSTHSVELQSGLDAIGRELYTLLFSAGEEGLAQIYCEIGDQVQSLLILCDAEPWIPWELVKPHGSGWEHDFLAIRCGVGRWVEGWGAPRHSEFPLGQVCLARDAWLASRAMGEWAHLLTPEDIPRLDSALFVDWPGGYLAAMDYASPVWGLHFENCPDQLSRGLKALAVRDAERLSSESVRDRWLDLRRKHPLVTFGMLSIDHKTALTDVESKWMPSFIRSGAGAFVGSLWATSPRTDRLFWCKLYQALWQRVPLGEAVLQARQSVRQMLPDSMDWLAYFLVGDPMAQGYVPRPGEGYTALECTNHDLESPLLMGKSYTFKASLRDAPPPWYEGRRYQAPEEAWETPQVFIFAHGFEVKPGSLLPLGKPVGGIKSVEFELTPKMHGEHDVFVKYVDGDEVRQTLSFTVNVIPGGAT